MRDTLAPRNASDRPDKGNASAKDKEWRHIDTAPKDGTQVLTWGCLHEDGPWMGETPRMRVTWRLEDVWYSPCSGDHEPTHWMPLPSPPADRTGK